MKAVYFVILCAAFAEVISTASPDTSWHEDIDWHTLEEAEELSKLNNKPIMLLIHKSWCGACKSLKREFQKSDKIAELSKDFNMVNTGDHDEPKGAKYAPDGEYIPRIFFINDGNVIPDLYSEKGNPKYKYYYNTADKVLDTMKIAAERFGPIANQIKEDL